MTLHCYIATPEKRKDNKRRILPAMLPPDNGTRWTALRKTRVVAAVISGVLTFEEASSRYSLSPEEFASWQRLAASQGL